MSEMNQNNNGPVKRDPFDRELRSVDDLAYAT